MQLRGLASTHDPDDSGFYYERRAEYNEAGIDAARRTALFLYLNRTCFNGLYRVNRRGQFNVPAGRYRNPCILDEENLRAVAAALKSVELTDSAFTGVLERARRGDLIYFDPPYDPVSPTASFMTLFISVISSPNILATIGTAQSWEKLTETVPLTSPVSPIMAETSPCAT